MAEPAGRPERRLDDPAVRERLERLDQLLARVEATPGPAGETAMEAVSALAEVYGEALARVIDHASGALVAALTEDELVGHLLVLHDLHPDPVERRVTRALDEVRTALAQHGGGDVELAGIDGDVANVRLKVTGCGSSTAGIADAVRAAVLAVAPELAEVTTAPAANAREAAFVPLDSLLRPPVTVTNGPRP